MIFSASNLLILLWLLRGILLGRVPFSALKEFFNSLQRTRWDEIRIPNSAGKVELYAHIHYPKDASPTKKYPGIVLVPGAIHSGAIFDRRGEADILSSHGFVVIHWDPEGRGKSGGIENSGGFIHQDGFHEICLYLSRHPFVDKDKIGIVSYSYGITFSGGVTRYPQNPNIKFWLDWEGPSDRKSIEKPILLMPNRPHLLLHDLSDEEYWSQRESLTFLRQLDCPYIRIQFQQDHAQPDNEHCVQCINAATHRQYGGEGRSPFTRVNDNNLNQPNKTYTYPDNQPYYITNEKAGWILPYILEYVNELLKIDV